MVPMLYMREFGIATVLDRIEESKNIGFGGWRRRLLCSEFP